MRSLTVLLLALLLGGCAGMMQRPAPLTAEDVVQMAKSGASSTAIIERLRETRTVLRLSGSQFARLREQGVPDDVLDHIQNTYMAAVEADTRLRYQGMYWGWGPPYPMRPLHGPLPYWYYR